MPKKLTTKEFIENAVKVHGDKYDYSKVVYVNNNTKVEIVCKEHGSFWQLPRHHISRGSGCPKCSGTYSDREYFISRAKEIHNNKYDYSKVEYVLANKKVIVTCPTHGDFLITPNTHLQGSGCKKCDSIRKSVQQRKPVFGVGINDCDGFITDKDYEIFYDMWTQMLRRCYSDKLHDKHKTYADCVVCDEWKTFSNFYKWAKDPVNGYVNGYFLDKDFVDKGNKTYSPEMCIFIPKEISSISTQSKTIRGDLPIGVTHFKDRYRVRFSKENKLYDLGCFSTPEKAFFAYKEAKEAHIRYIADKYFKEGKITEKAYNAFLGYKINIDD